MIGSLHASRDGAAISLANAVIGVNTGRDAFVWAFDQFQNNIFSGRDAVVISLGDVNGGVFASGSGLVYAVEDAIGAVDAGEYAGVVTWGDAAGPMTVKGPDGAFGWSYGDFNGFVESTSGNAFLTAYGNGTGAVRGAGYAEVYTAGDWLGDVEGGDGAGGIALGNFGGSVTAGSNGYIISEGSVNASLDADRDAFVWAIGDVAGNFSAGRDAAAVAYGDYAADISADRDVVTVWARGDLSGAITAGRNVGFHYADPLLTDYDIFSFGAINASITALNPSSLTDGGHIGTVGAWGPIDGTLEAADTIHGVRSGDAVTATLIAPNLPAPVEFDSTITTDHPYPDTPASVHDEVMAAIADDYDLVMADRAQIAADIALLLADFATDKAAEAAAIADLRGQILADVATASTDAGDALAADIAAANAALDAEIQAAQAKLDAFQTTVVSAEATFHDAGDTIRQQRDAAYDATVAFAAQAVAGLAATDIEMVATVSEIPPLASASVASREEEWDVFATRMVGGESDTAAESMLGGLWTGPTQAEHAGSSVFWAMAGTLPTSLQAIGNAIVDTLVNTATLGTVDDLEVFGGEDKPYYDSAYIPARITCEIIVTLGTGGASGSAGKVGKIARAYDAISSAVSFIRGVDGIIEDPTNPWAYAQVAFGAFGLGYNGRGFVDDASGLLPSSKPKATDALAQEIRGAGQLPGSTQTVAVTQTLDGPTIVHAQPDLSDAQKALAESKRLHVAPDDPGLHAELGTMAEAGDLGLKPSRTRTTNKVCRDGEGNCYDTLYEWGYDSPGAPKIRWHEDGHGFDIDYGDMQ